MTSVSSRGGSPIRRSSAGGAVALSRDAVAAKYTGRRCPRVESYIVEFEGRAIGYVQYHLEGPGQAGLDMMLLPEFRHRGLGPKVARVMVGHLRSAFGWTDITVDPAQDNGRAIRAPRVNLPSHYW